MSTKIANFLYFIILIWATNYYQLSTLAEQQEACPADDSKSEIICPALTGNYSSKNEV